MLGYDVEILFEGWDADISSIWVLNTRKGLENTCRMLFYFEFWWLVLNKFVWFNYFFVF